MIRYAGILLLSTCWVLRAQPAVCQESICGARCVHRVLEHFGKKDELTDIVRELYDSPQGGPVSLADLGKAIEKRGISCTMLGLGALDVPRSAHPLILHVDGNHFVVQEEGNLWSATVWDGLKGSDSMATWRLRMRSSDVVLSCMPPGQEGLVYADSTFRYSAMIAGSFLIGVGGWRACRMIRSRSQRQSLPVVLIGGEVHMSKGKCDSNGG